MMGVSKSDINYRREHNKALTWTQRKFLEIHFKRGDKDICFYCHRDLCDTNRTIDHVIPKVKGGTNELWNLCLACQTCNAKKGERDAHEFLEELRVIRSGYVENEHLTQSIVVPKSVVVAPAGLSAFPWTGERDDAKRRIADVRRNGKGHPDP